MRDSLDALIVGAGFNGLWQLHRLREEGFDVRLVEAADGLGGVWQNNRYPGARVDSHVPNYEYAHEPIWRNWNWSELFPGRDELVRYFEHVDEVLDLRRSIDLGVRVAAAHWRDADRLWHVTSDRGAEYDARFLVLCTGFGSAPYVPDLPDLADFHGPCHHTALWPEAGVDLRGQKVGVLGTGASGVQVVQEAAKEAERLVVLQRTPVTAIPMRQRQLSVEEQVEAKKSYREVFALRNAPPGSFYDIQREDVGALEVSAGERERVFRDRWERGGFHFWVGTFKDVLSDAEANRTAYDFWRDRTRERLRDEAAADILAPMEPLYPFGTKRPSLEQDYYDLFDEDHVHLVDLRQTPLERVTRSGLRTSTEEIELDVLVLATGFDANTGGLTALDLRGRGGVLLRDTWSDGVATHMGVAVYGFPNMLMLYGPQSPASFCNGPVCAELQGEWTVELLLHMRELGLASFEPTAGTGRRWSTLLERLARTTLFGKTDSWYMGANIPGKTRQLLNHPNADAYLDRLRECAEAGYDGFVLR